MTRWFTCRQKHTRGVVLVHYDWTMPPDPRTSTVSYRMPLRVCTALICVAVVSGFGPPAGAGEPSEMDALIRDLDAPGLEARENAQGALAGNESVTLADVESALRASDLSPEQRLRLEASGRELFSREPRAGLGVRFGNPAAVGQGVPLAGVVDGFPASKLLRPGDVILSINGQPLSNQTHMGAMILSHLPGEMLRVELERPRVGPGDVGRGLAQPPAEFLVLDVPLGRYDDLNTGVELSPARLDLAYRQRLARKTPDRPELRVIGSGLSPSAWLRAEGYDAEEGLSPTDRLERVPAWRIVGLGGQPPSELAAVDLRRGDSTAMRTRANRALQASGIYDEIEEALAGFRALAHRLTEIRDELGIAAQAAARAVGDDDNISRRLRALQIESDDIERTLGEIREVFDRSTQQSSRDASDSTGTAAGVPADGEGAGGADAISD